MKEIRKFGMQPVTVTQSAADFDPEALRLMAIGLHGTEAAFNGSSRTSNPHAPGGPEFDAWAKAFDQTSSVLANRQ